MATTRRTRRKAIAAVLLALMLAALVTWYINYRATGSLEINIAAPTDDSIIPPEYLYSFAGEGDQTVQRPLGVLADGDRVFVADSAGGKVFEFEADGTFVRTFGEDQLTTPLYIAKNPTNGRLYVSDRRQRQVVVFDSSGAFIEVFDPKLPEDQLPEFDTGGDVWMPVALAFGEDGTMYVTEFLKGHRLVIFGPDGTFKRSVGEAGAAGAMNENPEEFQFPNGVAVHGDEVWVTDSNNRRVQVFNLEGDFQYIVPVQGLPRGIGFLERTGDTTATAERLVIVDTLAHDATIWNGDGAKLAVFGTRGVLEGQFNYPNGASVGEDNIIFIADTSNSRVQAWGWPQELSPLPKIPVPPYWRWCLSPLLLLPLLLLARKKRFMATRDFVESMFVQELVHSMPAKRRKWIVTAEDYEVLRDLEQGGIQLGELLNVFEYSDADARALEEKLDVSRETAIVLATAQRVRVFCTEDQDMARLARLLEIDTVDSEQFQERFGERGKNRA